MPLHFTAYTQLFDKKNRILYYSTSFIRLKFTKILRNTYSKFGTDLKLEQLKLTSTLDKEKTQLFLKRSHFRRYIQPVLIFHFRMTSHNRCQLLLLLYPADSAVYWYSGYSVPFGSARADNGPERVRIRLAAGSGVRTSVLV